MRENVAMQNVEPGVVNEATPHLEIARHSHRFPLLILERNFIRSISRWCIAGWNWKNIPPDQILFHLRTTAWFPRTRIVGIQVTLARRQIVPMESIFGCDFFRLRIDIRFSCLWIDWRFPRFRIDKWLIGTKHFDDLKWIRQENLISIRRRTKSQPNML